MSSFGRKYITDTCSNPTEEVFGPERFRLRGYDLELVVGLTGVDNRCCRVVEAEDLIRMGSDSRELTRNAPV